jgi:large subunit ribosomal protein L21
VVPDDKLFLHRMNGVDVNDKVQFNRVLLFGTPRDTLIGRPFLANVTVTAAVEEHIRDSSVYIYKRRRAKGYRRFRGFRAVRRRSLAAQALAMLSQPPPRAPH